MLGNFLDGIIYIIKAIFTDKDFQKVYLLYNVFLFVIIAGVVSVKIEEMKESFRLKHILGIPFYLFFVLFFLPSIALMIFIWLLGKIRVFHLICLIVAFICTFFCFISDILNTELSMIKKSSLKDILNDSFYRNIKKVWFSEDDELINKSFKEILKEYFKLDIFEYFKSESIED